MKISDSTLNSVSTAAQQSVQQTTSANQGQKGGAPSSTGTRDDHVQLSNLSSALNTLSPGSPQRDARVNDIAAAYQANAYTVNPAALSSSLVNDALGLR